MSNFQSIYSFSPELTITISILLIIISNLLKKSNQFLSNMMMVSMISTMLMLYLTGSNNQALFLNLIVIDPFSTFFKVLILLSSFSIFIISLQDLEIESDNKLEFYILFLSTLLGMFLLVSSINLLMLYLALELVSIPSYILAGLNKNDQKSNEASLKYVIFGSFASGIMLFGMSWLYGISGSLNIYEIHLALQNSGNPFFIYIAFIFILSGFGYKISMFPFHYWTPDVYEGSPTIITAFFSIAPKMAGIGAMIRAIVSIFTYEGTIIDYNSYIQNVNWTLIIAVLSACTMSIGNILAIQQNNVKRMLAFSSISHVGFILMGLTVVSKLAISYVLFYLVIYIFMNLSAFYVLLYVQNIRGAYIIDEWNGLSNTNPVISAFMVIALISLAGLPPSAGFFGKVYLFSVLIENKVFYWLAIIGILNSVISLYYYFKLVKSMYLDELVEVKEVNDKSAFSFIKWSAIILSSQNLIFYFYHSTLFKIINNSLSFWPN